MAPAMMKPAMMKPAMIILALVGLLVAAFLGFLYYVLRTKVDDLSSQEPYVSLIGQKLELTRDVSLALNREPEVREKPMVLTESEVLGEGVVLVERIKAGTPLHITAVKNFTNGTSGFTTRVAFGKIDYEVSKYGTVEFEYEWREDTEFEPHPALWRPAP